MPYTHFRFIAYEVPTLTRKSGAPSKSAFPAGLICDPVVRIPVDPNTPRDARIRLRRFAAVVNRAAITLADSGVDDTNTLKVFMAPEFYFRPDSEGESKYTNQTYPYAEAAKILEELNSMFLHADFKDWLIVPGSILWRFGESQIDPLYRNSAIYVRGNVKDSLRIVEKDVPSRIDNIPYPGGPKTDNYDPYIHELFRNWVFMKNHVFSIDGAYCGLEVCLDHGNRPDHRVLKTVLANWHRNEPYVPRPELSLHLLTAGGMDLDAGSIAARKNGHILRNDGFPDDPYSQLWQVDSYLLDDNSETTPEDLLGTADYSEIDPDSSIASGGLELTGNELVPMYGNGYAEFPQRLIFYERCKL